MSDIEKPMVTSSFVYFSSQRSLCLGIQSIVVNFLIGKIQRVCEKAKVAEKTPTKPTKICARLPARRGGGGGKEERDQPYQGQETSLASKQAASVNVEYVHVGCRCCVIANHNL